MQAPAGSFSEMAFSEDGGYAVGKTDAGVYVIGNMYLEEEDLITRIRVFASGTR